VSGAAPPAAVLLDTCAVIWLAAGAPMTPSALDAIAAAAAENGVLVSPVSAWEIGLLSRPRPGRPALQFLPEPTTWFARLLEAPGLRLTPLQPGPAIEASHLPGIMPGDPGDRLIVATARHLGVPVVTRDRAILAYGAEGHVRVLPC